MSFLSKIFKKKPGGTFVGNVIRGVAHAVSPKLGTGKGKITQEEYDRKNMSDADFYNKYGYAKDTSQQIQPDAPGIDIGEIIENAATVAAQNGSVKGVVEKVVKPYKDVVEDLITDGAQYAGQTVWQKYKGWIIAGGLLVVGLFAWLFVRSGKK